MLQTFSKKSGYLGSLTLKTRYEGRGCRGLHHHASLSIATYGFLSDGREDRSLQKNLVAQASAFPVTIFVPQ